LLNVGEFAAQDPQPAKPAPAQAAQVDLSGTYTGTFDCEPAGLMGESTLTITGNQFTTADGKTGRIVAVDPAPGTCSLASEVAATIAEHAFDCLKAPVIRLTAPDIPVPFSPVLEQLLYPGVDAIVAAVRRLCGSQTSSSTSHVVEMTRRARER
jgi:hypothetical protein